MQSILAQHNHDAAPAREGVIHLLEKNVSADELPAICLSEWSKSHPNLNSLDATRLKEAEIALTEYTALPKRERNALQIYQRLTTILTTR
jgi:hypothetical protein